ncbi:MAG: DNA/RNA nuclease SfsA [Desulfohalobiaceae bacterium]
MKLPPLVPGTLLRRYKRFLADVKLDSGQVVTAHCPNTGSMLGCSEPGSRVYLSRHDAPTRKYPCTWQIIRMPGTLVGVNTMLTNKLLREAVDAARISELI